MRIPLIILGLVVVLAAGLLVYVAAWDIPAPTQHIEKVVPNDRLGK